MIVYKATNKVNGKVYIGITQNDITYRINQHIKSTQMGSKLSFHCAIRKHGVDNFSFEIIDKADDRIMLQQLEKQYIKQYRSNKNGYNMTTGGDGYHPIEYAPYVLDIANGMGISPNMFIKRYCGYNYELSLDDSIECGNWTKLSWKRGWRTIARTGVCNAE
jgi:predicted GIY-YIG superfamily endonuclease